MSPSKINFLLTGATGYIGGSVLSRFLAHPKVDTFNITALVRSAEKAEKLRTLGVNVIVGSHSDLPLIEKLAAEADVMVAAADSDDVPVTEATLRGFKKRFGVTGVAPIFIHTSGTGVLGDNAAGNFHYETIYDDANPDQIETLALSQQHRPVDVAIVAADKEGYVKSYIVLPSAIYGIATGKLVDLGIQNPYSILNPSLIRASISRGQGGMVGQGKNIWNNVHIDEIADLYIILYDSITANPNTAHGREGFYFGENGQHTLYEVGKRIAEVLVKLGIGNSGEPTKFTKEEIDKYFGGSEFWGSNSRGVANRSRSLGWKPTKTAKDMLESIEPDVLLILGRH